MGYKEDSLELKNNLFSIFGKKSKVIEEDPENIEYERFSSGSLLLDRNLKSGFVKGTVVELFGQTGSGKTTACIHAIAEHQKKYPDEIILWIDLEKTFDPYYFKKIGIDLDPEKFILLRPEKGEEVWESIITMTRTYKKGAIVLDSVALLLNEKEFEGDVGDAQMAGAARMNSQGFRKLFPFVKFGGTTIFCINQTRKSLGVMMGDNNVTTGGECWGFYSRTRIKCTVAKGSEGIYGKHKYRLVKATYGHKDSVAETTIYYGEGINKLRELVDLCVEYEILQKKGAFFYYKETNIAQGQDKLVVMLQDNPELTEELELELLKIINNKEVETSIDEDENN